ncbi:hypothetical protein GEMRC1_008334 [Eukaryota sp. GEM-RC1]
MYLDLSFFDGFNSFWTYAGIGALSLTIILFVFGSCSRAFRAITFYYIKVLRSSFVISFMCLLKPFTKGSSPTDFAQKWVKKHQYPNQDTTIETSSDFSGGMRSSLVKLTIKTTDESNPSPQHVVVKYLPHKYKAILSSLLLDTSKEAKFYQHFQQQAASVIPNVYYSHANMSTGVYTIIMEDLSDSFLVGKILGNQCWGEVDVPAEFDFDHTELINHVFLTIADLHSTFWNDSSLFKHKFLKNTDHCQGKGRNRFEFGVYSIKSKWNAICKATAKGTMTFKWSPTVVKAINTLFSNSSWKQYRSSLTKQPYTLVHQDFHPNNMMIDRNRKLSIFDWSEAGVGCPFSDLSQWMISHVDPELRRRIERTVVRNYYDKLVENGVDVPSFEQCFQYYIVGGIERWLQMLIIMGHFYRLGGLPEYGLQFFYDQVEAFVSDHFNSCDELVLIKTMYCLE